MNYTDEFKEFVKMGIGNYYIGIGNPNAKMLFIGKEASLGGDDNGYLSNAEDWQERIGKEKGEILNYQVDEKHPLRKGWGRNTWSKYQKLVDYTLSKTPERFKVDFLEHVFTTEINDAPNKNTAHANKSGLNERKELFKNSKFIDQFPVVVLACSDYIRNDIPYRDINDIFRVQYDGDESGKHEYSDGNWFFSHHNPNKSKLVIHTRQLSSNVDNDMLQDMGRVIKEHLKL